jgi:hypothetical protein
LGVDFRGTNAFVVPAMAANNKVVEVFMVLLLDGRMITVMLVGGGDRVVGGWMIRR